MSSEIIDFLLSCKNSEAALRWLKKARKHHPPNADVWHFIFHYKTYYQPKILQQLRSKSYLLSPMLVYKTKLGESRVMWSASDAFVIRLVQQTLLHYNLLPVSDFVTHTKRSSSSRKVGMHTIRSKALNMPFVCRTDIKGYYAAIPKLKMIEWLYSFNIPPEIQNILTQFLMYNVEDGGNISLSNKGIPRSSSLSPYLAAAHFYELDELLGHCAGIYYQRYMDDFLILSTTRHKLRKAIKRVRHCISNQWDFELHPDKTVIGRTSKGFDWMGLWFDGENWEGPSQRSKQRSSDKLAVIYNNYQGEEREHRLINYEKAYNRWLKGIMGN